MFTRAKRIDSRTMSSDSENSPRWEQMILQIARAFTSALSLSKSEKLHAPPSQNIATIDCPPPETFPDELMDHLKKIARELLRESRAAIEECTEKIRVALTSPLDVFFVQRMLQTALDELGFKIKTAIRNKTASLIQFTSKLPENQREAMATHWSILSPDIIVAQNLAIGAIIPAVGQFIESIATLRKVDQDMEDKISVIYENAISKLE